MVIFCPLSDETQLYLSVGLDLDQVEELFIGDPSKIPTHFNRR